MSASIEDYRTKDFYFKAIHPLLAIGTASDRYTGWLGQIYTPERYVGRIKKRTKRVAGQSFVEEVLPVDSVQEYFEHFDVLELDFTFYGPLRDAEGQATRIYHTLASYCQHLKKDDRIILKVPQIFFAKKVWQKDVFGANPYYLDADGFIKQFYEPALEIADPWIKGLLFEQEYHRKQDRPSPKEVAAELDRFFLSIPEDLRYHVELRTEGFLCPELFEVFHRHRVGQVLSHWTWLPSLRRQFSLAGKEFFSKSGECIIRLMTPRGMRYEDAYAKAHPFDKLVDGMMQEFMVRDTVEIAREGIARDVRVNVIINNRAGGNAPLIAKRVVSALVRAIPQDSR